MSEKVSIEIVTPEIAAEWLKKNQNRDLRVGYVKQLARDYRAGRFPFTGSPLVLSKHGKLLDGQHRLAALIAAGMDMKFTVVRGVEDEAQAYMDSGRTRTVADHLKMGGDANASYLSSVLMSLSCWLLNGVMNRGGHLGGYRPSKAEILTLRRMLPGVVDANQSWRSMVGALPGIRLSKVGALYWIAKQIDEKKAEHLIYVLGTGDESDLTHPVRVCRETILRDLGRVRQASEITRLVWIVKAWNASYEGVKVGRFTYDRREFFPTIAGDEPVREKWLKKLGWKKKLVDEAVNGHSEE